MLEVKLRGGFSDRNGIKPENTDMQYKDFDNRTRIAFYNFVDLVVKQVMDINEFHDDWSRIKLCILRDVYVQEVDYSCFNHGKEYKDKYILDIFKETLMNDSYDAVLTLLEYFVAKVEDSAKNQKISDYFNKVLKKEYVGYRYVNSQIIPITSDEELAEIKEAMNSPFDTVNESFYKASSFLSDRHNPDYENSIKESITAVEKMCSIILGKNSTLGDALKQLEHNGVKIHPCLKSAFEKLYGYTSDASGIRHCGQLDGSKSTFEEARFMFVSCSAFVNYLIQVSGKK